MNYHDIKDRLSASIAHTLVSRSPAHARWELDHPTPPTDAMVRGTLLHALVLEQDDPEVTILDFPDFRTKAAQEARDGATGLVMLAHKWGELETIAGAIRSGVGTFEGYDVEEPILWESEGVLCKSKPDVVGPDVVIDLKFVDDASPSGLGVKIVRMGYDIQAAAYLEATGKREFRFVFCETSAPYAVATVRAEESILEVGRRRWARAREMWLECTASGVWPGYGLVTVTAPAWALGEE